MDLKNLLSLIQGKILWNEPMSRHVSYKIGGPADVLIYPKDEKDLCRLMKMIHDYKLSYFILGDGSNVLFSDDGYRGIVIEFSKLNKIEVLKKNKKNIFIYVSAGVNKQKLLFWAIEHGFSGLQFLAGVPGQIGGGLFMNAGTQRAGTRGENFGKIAKKVFLVNKKGEKEDLELSPKDFDYRSQHFCKGKIITGAILKLRFGNKKEMLKMVKKIISQRKAIQPLQYPNCGSVFKNPKGQIAGKLIEQAGLKGHQIGGAAVSKKHANFIVNTGGAKAKDVLAVIRHVKQKVKEAHGIELQEEIVIVS